MKLLTHLNYHNLRVPCKLRKSPTRDINRPLFVFHIPMRPHSFLLFFVVLYSPLTAFGGLLDSAPYTADHHETIIYDMERFLKTPRISQQTSGEDIVESMIPSAIPKFDMEKLCEKAPPGVYISIDWGGSSLKLVAYRVSPEQDFKEICSFQIEHKARKMLKIESSSSPGGEPGKVLIEREEFDDIVGHGDCLRASLFFPRMAKALAIVVSEVQASQLNSNEMIYIGLTFSHPMTHSSPRKGKIVGLSKNTVDDSEDKIIGQDPVELLEKAIAACPTCSNFLKDRIKVTALLNDAVASFFAAQKRHSEVELIGSIILGTGTNVAIRVKGICTNTEFGSFSSCLLNRRVFDLNVDQKTSDILMNVDALQSIHPFEKLVAGGYLGRILHELLLFSAFSELEGELLRKYFSHCSEGLQWESEHVARLYCYYMEVEKGEKPRDLRLFSSGEFSRGSDFGHIPRVVETHRQECQVYYGTSYLPSSDGLGIYSSIWGPSN